MSDVDLLDTISSGGASEGGTLILIPGMSFGCWGSISSWSGLVAVSTRSPSETFTVSFQVWRPLGEGMYNLIGSDLLEFVVDDSELCYPFGKREGISTGYNAKGISFQPGDIIGCFIPPAPNLELIRVFQSTPLDEEKGVDLMVFHDIGGDPCEAFSCDKSPTTVQSVVPLFRPHCRGKR